MNDCGVHGPVPLAAHHSCVVFDMPTDISTMRPSGAGVPSSARGRIAAARARAAARCAGGGTSLPSG